MAISAALQDALHDLPLSLVILTAPAFLVVGTLVVVRLFTSSKYRYSLSVSQSANPRTKNAVAPPVIPYTIPFLGHAIAFLAPRPGQFWAKLYQIHPRSTGACTLLLGGQKTYILFSPDAVQALFKVRGIGRDSFNLQIEEKGLGIDHIDALRYNGFGEGPDHTGSTPLQQQDRIHHNYMLEKMAVNELTAEFTRVLKDQLAGELKAFQ